MNFLHTGADTEVFPKVLGVLPQISLPWDTLAGLLAVALMVVEDQRGLPPATQLL